MAEAVVDVTAWRPLRDEPLGTKPKEWLLDPAGARWLWKQSTMQRDRRHGAFRKGDDWAEVVAGRVGETLAIPVAEVRLAVRGPDIGIVSKNVLADVDAEELDHGNDLLAGAGIGTGDPRDRTGYTVDAVAGVLDGVDAPPDVPGLVTAFGCFAGYLLLDALVGNTDRHQDNWAVIRSTGRRRLAPSFDHASCLGFQLSDTERLERVAGLDANRTVATYADAATTKFEGHPQTIDAAVDAVRRLDQRQRDHWWAAIDRVPDLEPMLVEIPVERMSEPARRFADALYRQNLATLRHPLRTIGS